MNFKIRKFKKLLTLIIIALGSLPLKNHNFLCTISTHGSRFTYPYMSRHEYPWSYTNSHVFSKCPTFRFFLANMIFFPVPKKLDSKFKLWFLIKLNSQIRVRPSARHLQKCLWCFLVTNILKWWSHILRAYRQVSKLFCSLIKHWNILIFNFLFHNVWY